MTTWLVPVLVLVAVIVTGLICIRLIHGDRPLPGDAEEAPGDVSPHDLPFDHPGRLAAEREARFERASSRRA